MKPHKAAKRSGAAWSRFINNTTKRVGDLFTNPANPNTLSTFLVEQVASNVELNSDLWSALADDAPIAVLKADISGAAANPSEVVMLDDPVNNLNNLGTTPLVFGAHPALALGQLEAVPPNAAPIETIRIKAAVPQGTQTGLYQGFVMKGQAIQVKVFLWVHT